MFDLGHGAPIPFHDNDITILEVIIIFYQSAVETAGIAYSATWPLS